MEQIVGEIMDSYLNVTLACVIVGYLVTTTPYLETLKRYVPLLVTAFGAVLGVVLYGMSVDVAVYGALAGILSTGLYELFGKGIKNFGNLLGKKGILGSKDEGGDA